MAHIGDRPRDEVVLWIIRMIIYIIVMIVGYGQANEADEAESERPRREGSFGHSKGVLCHAPRVVKTAVTSHKLVVHRIYYLRHQPYNHNLDQPIVHDVLREIDTILPSNPGRPYGRGMKC